MDQLGISQIETFAPRLRCSWPRSETQTWAMGSEGHISEQGSLHPGGPSTACVAAHPWIAGCATQIYPLLAQFQTQISINFLTWILEREPRVPVIATSRTATFWGSRRLQLTVFSTTVQATAPPSFLTRAPHIMQKPPYMPPTTQGRGAPLGVRCPSLKPCFQTPRGIWPALAPRSL